MAEQPTPNPIALGAGLGLALGLCWAVIIAQPKPGNTCPHCGYSTKGLPTTTCPECGKPIDEDPPREFDPDP